MRANNGWNGTTWSNHRYIFTTFMRLTDPQNFVLPKKWSVFIFSQLLNRLCTSTNIQKPTLAGPVFLELVHNLDVLNFIQVKLLINGWFKNIPVAMRPETPLTFSLNNLSERQSYLGMLMGWHKTGAPRFSSLGVIFMNILNYPLVVLNTYDYYVTLLSVYFVRFRVQL